MSDVCRLRLNGRYMYLVTRRKQYAFLVNETDSEWSEALCSHVEGFLASVAEMVATVLTSSGRSMELYIHGDVKSENLFTTANGEEVAFFDFKYVGLGLGVWDLAKLFTCSVPLDMLVDDEEYLPEQLPMRDGEKQLLQAYCTRLLQGQKSDMYD
ncbi:hypothetical protein AbraIFM66950_006166 [Aspergillus brasiliensis]|nr:hypothetical protein AbraIFM66950_006166 [Aspergillus brasiliensis]